MPHQSQASDTDDGQDIRAEYLVRGERQRNPRILAGVAA